MQTPEARAMQTPQERAIQTPRLVMITALDVVPEATLLDRIRAAGELEPSLRARVAVQIRDPQLSGRALLRFATRVRDAARAASIALLVNDRLDLAASLGADGVHLGRLSVAVADARAFLGPTAFVSVSCHSVDEAAHARASGADAALLSPIFPSPGKGPPLGAGALREAAESLPIIALGGVDNTTTSACFAAGAEGVAAIRADLLQSVISTLAGHLAT